MQINVDLGKCRQVHAVHTFTTAIYIAVLSQNHRISEWQGLESTCEDHLVQLPCQNRIIQSKSHRYTARCILDASREGESAAFLCRLFQSSASLKEKNIFLIFTWSLLCSSLCLLPLFLLPLRRVWFQPPGTCPLTIYKAISSR